MKRLTFVAICDQIKGKVIEHRIDGFYLFSYYINIYGNYVYSLEYQLSNEEESDVLHQKNLKARLRRLHYYFNTAEYISEEVVDVLNFDDLNEELVCDLINELFD